MRRSTPALLLSATLALGIFGDGCGGGGGGSRPPTVVSGNVRTAAATASTGMLERLWRMAAAWWRSEAVAQVPGINVAIEGSTTSENTDDLGFFRLEGNQFGATALHFSGNGADARYPLTLPAGGEVDLIDVDLAGSEVTIGQHRIHFEGPITGLDCQASLMQVLSGSLVAFRVRFNFSTAIVDPAGKPLTCGGLVIGGSADVEGVVNSAGDVVAVQIRTDPTAIQGGQTQTLQGTLVSRSCPATLVVSDTAGNVQVNLGATTTLTGLNGESLTCGDLVAGDSLEIEGVQGGFGVNATRVTRISPTPTPTPEGTPTPKP